MLQVWSGKITLLLHKSYVIYQRIEEMADKVQQSATDEERHGFSIAPNPNCPHIAAPTFQLNKKLVITASGSEGKAPRRNLFAENNACQQCGDADETWVCLLCSFSGCSRYKSAHMVCHVRDEFHDHTNAVIAISLADLSVWCFSCDSYVTHPKLEPAFREFHRGKFGTAPSKPLHGEGRENSKRTITFLLDTIPEKGNESNNDSQQKET